MMKFAVESGIKYHNSSPEYILLFRRFTACGYHVWYI